MSDVGELHIWTRTEREFTSCIVVNYGEVTNTDGVFEKSFISLNQKQPHRLFEGLCRVRMKSRGRTDQSQKYYTWSKSGFVLENMLLSSFMGRFEALYNKKAIEQMKKNYILYFHHIFINLNLCPSGWWNSYLLRSHLLKLDCTQQLNLYHIQQ